MRANKQGEEEANEIVKQKNKCICARTNARKKTHTNGLHRKIKHEEWKIKANEFKLNELYPLRVVQPTGENVRSYNPLWHTFSDLVVAIRILDFCRSTRRVFAVTYGYLLVIRVVHFWNIFEIWEITIRHYMFTVEIPYLILYVHMKFELIYLDVHFRYLIMKIYII